jgi:hypothetical protein
MHPYRSHCTRKPRACHHTRLYYSPCRPATAARCRVALGCWRAGMRVQLIGGGR